ncbi:MAG: hypothetical protein MI919_04855, partial [Holophagales bacterium]|nr:hypothetical protein [Holophagales bacterium]
MALAGIVITTGVAAAAAPGTAEGASSADPARWPIQELRNSFHIRHDLLNRHGVRVENTTSTVAAIERHRLSLASEEGLPFSALMGPSMDLLVKRGTPVGLSGAVWHQGGFDVVWDGGRASLQAFGLRTGKRHLSLQIVDREGVPVFDADHMHFRLDPRTGRFQAFNMDLRLSRTLAERLGKPLLAGASVGLLALEASLVAPDLDGDRGRAAEKNACDDFSGEVDVALNEMSRVDNRLQMDGKVVMTPSAELVNVGTANVPWHSKFSSPSPPYDNDQHPFLVWAFYRLSEGRLEQLAVSDIKHAFLTLNFGCDPGACTQGNILGLGCGDVYGSGTNDSNNSLSYRHEVTAGLGLWESTGSHFDPDNDGSQEHPPQNPDGPFDHRSWVETTELETPGASYYTGAWYLVRDDIDIFNNMGYRLVNPQLVGATWDFGNAGPYTQGS